MNESDLDYLRNINTTPGANAGRSIDPTKPGPDAYEEMLSHRVAKLEQEVAGLTPEQRATIDAQMKAWSDAAKAALAQSDAGPETYGDQLRRVMKRQAMQSDAEPVAWQWRAKYTNGNWCDWKDGVDGDFWDQQPSGSYERRNLYAVPPRPDTSAELIEAEKAIEGLLSEWDKFCKYGSPMARLANERVTYARKVLANLRSPAADRSMK